MRPQSDQKLSAGRSEVVVLAAIHDHRIGRPSDDFNRSNTLCAFNDEPNLVVFIGHRQDAGLSAGNAPKRVSAPDAIAAVPGAAEGWLHCSAKRGSPFVGSRSSATLLPLACGVCVEAAR